MKIIKARAYSGPNALAPQPLVHFRVDFGAAQIWPYGAPAPHGSDALLRLLPGLAEHPGSNDEPEAFVRELGNPPDLPLGYVVARVAVELQRQHGGAMKSAGVSYKPNSQIQDFFFGYDDPDLGLLSGRFAINIAISLLPPEMRSTPDLPGDFDARKALTAFNQRAEAIAIDQTAAALIQEAQRRDIPWFWSWPTASAWNDAD